MINPKGSLAPVAEDLTHPDSGSNDETITKGKNDDTMTKGKGKERESSVIDLSEDDDSLKSATKGKRKESATEKKKDDVIDVDSLEEVEFDKENEFDSRSSVIL